jgi:hypothetical protein
MLRRIGARDLPLRFLPWFNILPNQSRPGVVIVGLPGPICVNHMADESSGDSVSKLMSANKTPSTHRKLALWAPLIDQPQRASECRRRLVTQPSDSVWAQVVSASGAICCESIECRIRAVPDFRTQCLTGQLSITESRLSNKMISWNASP